MPHKINRACFLAVWLAVCLFPLLSAQDFSHVELGKFTIPRDLEVGLTILPKGEYLLDLIKGRRSGIGLGTFKPDEMGMTRSWSDTAEVTEITERYPQPT